MIKKKKIMKKNYLNTELGMYGKNMFLQFKFLVDVPIHIAVYLRVPICSVSP